MANPIKTLHHWIKAQQFQFWLHWHGACKQGKAPYKGMTAEEAYWASDKSSLLWALALSGFNNLPRFVDSPYPIKNLKQFKLALGFPTKAKDKQLSTYEARQRFIADNKLG